MPSPAGRYSCQNSRPATQLRTTIATCQAVQREQTSLALAKWLRRCSSRKAGGYRVQLHAHGPKCCLEADLRKSSSPRNYHASSAPRHHRAADLAGRPTAAILEFVQPTRKGAAVRRSRRHPSQHRLPAPQQVEQTGYCHRAPWQQRPPESRTRAAGASSSEVPSTPPPIASFRSAPP